MRIEGSLYQFYSKAVQRKQSGHSENCENEHVAKLAGTSGFAQYIAVGEEKIKYGGIYEIPEGVSYDAASLGEPLTRVFACLENAKIGYPDTVVIIGAGPIGDFMAQISKMRGARKAIMIDLNEHRLEDPQYAIDRVRELTGGKGADKVISATPANATQAQSLFMVKKGGLVVFFGGVRAH